MLYYNNSVLKAIANTIDKLVKVDTNTLEASRGRFARVYMELHLNKSLVGKFWLVRQEEIQAKLAAAEDGRAPASVDTLIAKHERARSQAQSEVHLLHGDWMIVTHLNSAPRASQFDSHKRSRNGTDMADMIRINPNPSRKNGQVFSMGSTSPKQKALGNIQSKKPTTHRAKPPISTPTLNLDEHKNPTIHPMEHHAN
ncbi:hypothetical protein L6164_013321 [Bauhinia variegata]|uniref:Uncharacterized protein n=1 Tax=Bauhinia variegata TaxID=167791 RepID=A0ACB9PE49_BAUVA|nr:hypothetical protein L6164_013321 [Bauhinia variegata]